MPPAPSAHLRMQREVARGTRVRQLLVLLVLVLVLVLVLLVLPVLVMRSCDHGAMGSQWWRVQQRWRAGAGAVVAALTARGDRARGSGRG